MKKRVITFLAYMSAAVSLYAADTVSYKIRRIENWAFYGTQNPTVLITAANPKGIYMPLNIKCEILDAYGKSLYELTQGGAVPPKDTLGMSYTFKTVTPGVYNALFWRDGGVAASLNIAYEPEKIVLEQVQGEEIPQFSRDFTKLANIVALERRGHNPQFTIVRNKKLSGKEKNVYDFKMVSKDNKVIKGLVAFPKGKKELPVMLTLVPVENMNENPLADFTAPAEMAEMVLYLSGRGNGEEYFKNLLTDVILGIDFLAQRNEIDKSKIYTQGEGMGAACSFVASALDERVAVSFVASPDFSSFTENFTVESIARKVKVPVLFGIGLQDKTSIIQNAFAIYNKVNNEKEYFIFPALPSVERNKWKYIRDTFIIRLAD
ncbi:MAG: acetylxylan esterase [Bacteroidales bacterium]|nr:acetylxylan esterase [Bacteroidales bacterium]